MRACKTLNWGKKNKIGDNPLLKITGGKLYKNITDERTNE
jgi:hypothetical protein